MPGLAHGGHGRFWGERRGPETLYRLPVYGRPMSNCDSHRHRTEEAGDGMPVPPWDGGMG